MAEFIDAALTQEVVDAKNDLQLQAERATIIVDSWASAAPPSGGGIEEAPLDGSIYSRQNADWVVSPTNEGGIEEAPVDGSIYARQNETWVLAPTGDGSGSGDMTAEFYNRIVYNNHSTGLYSGGELVINPNLGQFDVGGGTGAIVDSSSDPANPTYTRVSWNTNIGILATNIQTSIFTYIYIDINGAVLQSTLEPTPQLRRDNILLGKLIHQDNTSIFLASTRPEVIPNPSNQLTDFFNGLGIINLKGNQISPNGINLSIDKSSGTIHQAGINYDFDKKSPNIKEMSAQSEAILFYGTQSETVASPTLFIDATNYDVGGVITPVGGGSGTSTNQRVYLFSSGIIGVQYGQQTYPTLADAISGVQNEPFVIFQDLADNAILLGIISVSRAASDLSDTGVSFFTHASKFGEVSVGTGSLSVSTLQDTYNNSTTPQTVTSASKGALTVRQGTGADTDAVTQVQNGVGTVVHSVNGEGTLTFANATQQTTGFTDTLKTKLDSVSEGATANAPDNLLLDRSNHTGTQLATTISNFDAAVTSNVSVLANTAKVSFPEAPTDGKQYARIDSGWEEIVVPEAASVAPKSPSTNLIKYSEDFTVAIKWAKSLNCTVTVGSELSPNGRTNASNLTFSGSGSISQNIAPFPDKTITGSVWLKGNAGVQVTFALTNLFDSAKNTTVTMTGEWQREVITHTFSSSVANAYFYLGAENITVDVWGAQFEEDGTVSNYIMTEDTAEISNTFREKDKELLDSINNMTRETIDKLKDYTSIAALGVGDFSIPTSNQPSYVGYLPLARNGESMSIHIKYDATLDVYLITSTLHSTTSPASLSSNNYGSKWYRSVSPTIDSGWKKANSEYEGPELSGSGLTYADISDSINKGLYNTGRNFVNSADMGIVGSGSSSLVTIQSIDDGNAFHLEALPYTTNTGILIRSWVRACAATFDTGWVLKTGSV